MIKSLSFLFVAFCAITSSHFKPQEKTNASADSNRIVYATRSETRVSRTSPIIEYPDKPFVVDYFEKLRYNYGLNVKGSCPWIAAEMLLAYYDTVLNDNFIPESLDSPRSPCSVKYDVRTATYSPGSKREWDVLDSEGLKWIDLQKFSYNDYFDYAHRNRNYSLHLELLSRYMGNDYNDKPSLNVVFQGFPAQISTVKSIVEDYIDEKTDLNSSNLGIQTQSVILNITSNPLSIIELLAVCGANLVFALPLYNQIKSQSDAMKEKIKELTSQGIPVVVTAAPTILPNSLNPNNWSWHTFVAYEYNSDTDKIYSHGGWQDEITHSSDLLDSQYPYPMEIMWFEPEVENNYSENYKYYSTYFGPFDTLKPRTFEAPAELFYDKRPRFRWDSIADEYLCDMYGKGFRLHFYDTNNNEVYVTSKIKTNRYTLAWDEYGEILRKTNGIGSTFKVALDFCPEDISNYINLNCDKPNGYIHDRIQIKPIDWKSTWDRGFIVSNSTYNETQTINGMTFTTKRFRCWRDGTWIVLQPKQAGDSYKAYLEINFTTPVYSLMYSLSLRVADEEAGNISVYVKKANGSWTSIYGGLFNSPVNTETSEANPTRYTWTDVGYSSISILQHTAPTYEGIYGLKIQNSGTNTKLGAICIDDIVLDRTQPSGSGFFWSTDIVSKYGKSCLPNNVPETGNIKSIHPFDPDPFDPWVINAK